MVWHILFFECTVQKDDRVDFVSKIIENNRFEWENITLDVDHEKVIYIRDVWLSWYSNGLNSRYNTLESIIEKMKEENNRIRSSDSRNLFGWIYGCNIGI